MKDDMTEDTRDALEMIGKPIIAFEKPQDIIVRNDEGEYVRVKTPAWVKFSVGLRQEMKRLKGSRLAVFMCLCLHIDDKNECFPPLDVIALETGYSERECMRAVEELEVDKLITVIRRHRKSNTYSINAFAAFGDGNDPITLSSKVTQETLQNATKVTLDMLKKSPQEEPVKQNQKQEEPIGADTSPRKVDAVSVFFDNGGKGLTKESQQALLETPIIDFDLWGKIVKAYCLMGWNPRNALGMYGYYQRGEIPQPKAQYPQRKEKLYANGKTSGESNHGNSVSDEGREFAERLAARSAPV